MHEAHTCEMKVTVSVDENKRLLVPLEFEEQLKLQPGTSVTVDFPDQEVTEPEGFRQANFAAALDQYTGFMRQQFLADGYSTVDEFMDDVRPKW